MSFIFNLSLIAALMCMSAVFAYNDDSNIFYFFGSTYATHESYPLAQADAVLNHTSFDLNKPIVLYAHGFESSVTEDTSTAIVNAYIKNGNYNILLLDWSEIADNLLYFLVAYDLDQLGSDVAAFLIKLINKNFPYKKIHVVGHSLGGQLAGYIARYVNSQSDERYTLSRITGLDPAGPDFYGFELGTEAISSTDATFVDIIHTNAGTLGAPGNTGLCDFWPNGGKSQPGCDIPTCSHGRAVYYWAESVANGKAVSFTSYNSQNSSNKIQMGNNCPLNATPGVYNLATNRKSPYSKG